GRQSDRERRQSRIGSRVRREEFAGGGVQTQFRSRWRAHAPARLRGPIHWFTEPRRMSAWRSLPFAPPAGSRLCAAADVPDGQGKEIVFGEGKDAFRVVVFRLGERLFAYHNCCPHFS